MKGRMRGYTLLELIVVMAVFGIVMTLISVSFSRIVRSSSTLIKSAETDIGGLIGLELMRSDLELAGFGLPWSLPAGLTYSETGNDLVLVNSCADGCPGAKPSLFDDRYDVKDPYIPSPYRIGNNVGFNGSDYLVLKGTALGASSVSRSWCYLNYSSPAILVKPSRLEPVLQNGDRVIVVKTGAGAAGGTRELVTRGSANSYTAVFRIPFPADFSPRQKQDTYIVYGVAPDKDGQLLSFPFNRADYFLNRSSDISPNCNRSTAILYKTTIDHGGTQTHYPILDCAADLQVVGFWDTNEDGNIDYHTPVVAEAAGSVGELRARLKEIRVYILAQQGKRDPDYNYPVPDLQKAVVVGEQGAAQVLGRVWTAEQMAQRFGSDWRSYHWKLYTIVVQPKNL